MVQEIRKIIFSSDELLAAFQSYARTSPKFLPAGKLLSCTPFDGTESKVKVKIEVAYGDSINEIELSFRGTDVLQPLILFCIENNIMLPRDGRKSFSVVNERAILTVELNMESELGFLEAPMTTEHVRMIKPEGRT